MHNHLVFGAGLIGCYLGASIAKQGQSVSLLCRDKIRKKLQDGVTLTDYLQHSANINEIKFCDADFSADETHFDIVWLTVKCTGIERASQELAPFVGSDTTIICCQNGLGSENAVKTRYPNNQVLRAMVPFNVVEMSDGHYHRGSEGALTIESSGQHGFNVDELVEAIQSDVLPVSINSDMDALLWAKLQLNLGNSINALADIPVKAMLEQRQYRLVIALLMEELLAVTDALEISLPKVTALPGHWIPKVLRLPDFLFKRVANKMLAIDPNVRTSMWWDVSQGKATEIDYLNGAIVDEAKLLHIATPHNQQVIELIKNLAPSQPDEQRKSYTAQQLYKLVNG